MILFFLLSLCFKIEAEMCDFKFAFSIEATDNVDSPAFDSEGNLVVMTNEQDHRMGFFILSASQCKLLKPRMPELCLWPSAAQRGDAMQSAFSAQPGRAAAAAQTPQHSTHRDS